MMGYGIMGGIGGGIFMLAILAIAILAIAALAKYLKS